MQGPEIGIVFVKMHQNLKLLLATIISNFPAVLLAVNLCEKNYLVDEDGRCVPGVCSPYHYVSRNYMCKLNPDGSRENCKDVKPFSCPTSTKMPHPRRPHHPQGKARNVRSPKSPPTPAATTQAPSEPAKRPPEIPVPEISLRKKLPPPLPLPSPVLLLSPTLCKGPCPPFPPIPKAPFECEQRPPAPEGLFFRGDWLCRDCQTCLRTIIDVPKECFYWPLIPCGKTPVLAGACADCAYDVAGRANV